MSNHEKNPVNIVFNTMLDLIESNKIMIQLINAGVWTVDPEAIEKHVEGGAENFKKFMDDYLASYNDAVRVTKEQVSNLVELAHSAEELGMEL